MMMRAFKSGLFALIGLPLTGFSHDVRISGLIEAEAGYSKSFDDQSSSDLILATAALVVETEVNELSNALVSLLYEEDETELEIDEAILFLNFSDYLHLRAGQMYLPLGRLESMQISDPLTLEIGEIRETALEATFSYRALQLAAFAFNGDIDEGEDQVMSYGIRSDLQFFSDGFVVGGGYLSNFLDTDTLQDAFLELPAPAEHVGAWSAHTRLQLKNWVLLAEAIHALEHFAQGENRARPEAMNVEIGNTLEGGISLSLSHQTTDDCLWLELPRKAWLFTASSPIRDENLVLSFEYRKDEDYAADAGGSGESSDTITFQLAASF